MSFNAMNRRTFLETATTVTAATLLTSRLVGPPASTKSKKSACNSIPCAT